MKTRFVTVLLSILCALLTFGGLELCEAGDSTLDAADTDISDIDTEEVSWNHVDSTRRVVGSRLASMSSWVDAFFDDPDYTEEEADARLSFRQTATLNHDSELEYRMRISGSLSLPNLSRRVKLVFEGNDDRANMEDLGEQALDEAADGLVGNTSLGLQYRFLSRDDYDFRMSAGVRLWDGSIYVGPRFRAQTALGSRWHARFTQRVRGYSNDGLRSDTGVDIDRRVGVRNLFRQSVSTVWREDRYDAEGFRHTIATSFTQPLAKTRALRYTWSSDCLTRPTERWNSSTVSISYRSRLWRDWIVFELRPFLAWEEKSNWDTNPGVLISLSLIVEDDELTPKLPIE